jgi:hypothetical protein
VFRFEYQGASKVFNADIDTGWVEAESRLSKRNKKYEIEDIFHMMGRLNKVTFSVDLDFIEWDGLSEERQRLFFSQFLKVFKVAAVSRGFQNRAFFVTTRGTKTPDQFRVTSLQV